MALSGFKNLYGVILAGGSGTRLWPISRELYPKQLLKLFGNKTLIQQTFSRLKKIIPPEKIYIVTNQSFEEDIYLQLKGLGMIRENILVEPAQRNTAPAIALASKKIFNKDKSAIILTCPADHLIKPDEEFIRAVKIAFPVAQKNFLVIFGIAPTNPSSEYGYIKINSKNKVYKVEKFIEKPDKEEAEDLIKKGGLWNSGIFIWKAKIILQEIRKNIPEVYKAVKSQSYLSLQPISIDKGILEHSKKIRAIPANFQWQDIGSWKSLYQLLPKDSAQNVLNEKVLESGCQNCLIYGTQKRIVAAIGLENLIVVDTEDAVLVSHKEKTHEVKELLEKMKANNFPQYLQHPTTYRPWGSFTVIEEGKNFKVKKVVVKPKEKLSLQFHKQRSEHWVVLKGLAKVELNDKIFYLKPHQSIDVPVEVKHRLINPGRENLEIIEIQNGDYLGENDIIRIDDKYKRR